MGGDEVLPGRVEVVLEGPPGDVQAVLGEVTGPAAPGSVSGVETRDEPVQAVSGFTVG